MTHLLVRASIVYDLKFAVRIEENGAGYYVFWRSPIRNIQRLAGYSVIAPPRGLGKESGTECSGRLAFRL